MALSITQETDFRTVVPTVTGSDLGFRPGHSISNTSRAGEGIITGYTPTGFNEASGCANFTILVISGDFQAGDSFTCTPTGAGTISTVTAAPHPGVLVTGIMSDTDSTANTNEALDDEEVDITVTSSTVIPAGSIIRIEDTIDEYCFVEVIKSATEITVKRGLYGTIGTHATAKNIHIVDTNLCKQILDADVAGAWGYSGCSNGRLEMDCTIINGSPETATKDILITSNEVIDLSATDTNQWMQMGNTSDRSYFQNGLGWMNEGVGDAWEGDSFGGTKIFTDASVTTTNVPCIGCTSYYFGTEIIGVPNFRGQTFSWDLSIQDVPGYVVNLGHTEASRMYNTKANLVSVNIQTTILEAEKTKIYGGSTYWVYAFGAATLSGVEADERVAGSGFLCGGVKTQIDCKIAPYYVIFGTFAMAFLNYKTITANFIDEKGEPLEGVTCVGNFRINSTANIFSELSDADGVLEKQLVQFAYALLTPNGFTAGNPTNPILTRDVEFFFRKSGYQEVRKRFHIEDRDDPIVYKDIVLKKNRFRETKSRGGI